MKKMILFVGLSFLALSSMAQTSDTDTLRHDKYCAQQSGERVMVMYEGKPLTMDVTLDNGIVIKTDGVIVKEDGTRMSLRAGECMDKYGVITPVATKEEDATDATNHNAEKN